MAKLLNQTVAPIIEKLAGFLPVPARGSLLSPVEAMRLALSEARKGIGFAAPNPLVGCVLVDRDHRFLASGYHHQSGFAHAEIDALAQLQGGVGGDSAAALASATAYVTLEPCAHEGRTGSCARAFAGFPLRRVVYGLRDPFPLVDGQGAGILRAAGIEAVCLSDAQEFSSAVRDELIAECEEVAEIFLWNVRRELPFVAMKVASSLDGRMALANGESKWITGPEAREYSHYLRAHYDAVLIGRNTFVTDDPSLNIRLPGFARSANQVVLLDPSAKTLADLPSSQLMASREASQIFVVVDESACSSEAISLRQNLIALGVQFVTLPLRAAGFDIPVLLKALWINGIRSIFIEGGAQTFGTFLSVGAVQRLHLFIAPNLLGGHHGIAWSQGLSVATMQNRIPLSDLQPRLFGRDIYFNCQIK